MDEIQQIEFRMTYVERQDPKQIKMDYDKELDTLFLDLKSSPGPRSTYYIEDGVNAVYDPVTKEIVGFRVENWQLIFLRKHKDLRIPWYTYWLLEWFCRVCRTFDFSLRQQESIVKTITQYTPTLAPA